ncbi:MAG: Oligopeptide transport ATP-binding protein OppD [Chlamydiales bacterium]|nr:Oligopeptide transport ATP-binding protein OppD [Chlamydiales bacterium]MCH9636215.1 Oligopeptide transport ATP-binding protein OppD [Chlamydiales bacterium]MCH9703799.1 ABC transporter ATP-binding protein [Chlamydiota bacterium]
MSLLLSVRKLTTKLKINNKIHSVLSGISFDLHKGKTLAIVGETGCGKSMTALSIMRILPTPPALPPEGEIFYKGKDLLKLSSRQMRRVRGRHISMIFQDPSSALNPVYTIGDQLLEVCLAHLEESVEEARERVLRTLEEVQLPNPQEIMNAYPHKLSGGMLQRVMIAMAIILHPDVLIADEPTTALDVTIQAQILQLLRDLSKKRGMATLLITHDMGVVAEVADEVIVMYAGQKVEQGPVRQLFTQSAHPYTQALFASRPNYTMPKGALPTIEGSVPRITQLPTGCHFHPRCKYALPLCKKGKVPYFGLKQDEGHEVKCWLYDQDLEWKIDRETITED